MVQEFHSREQFEEINRFLLNLLEESYTKPETKPLNRTLDKKEIHDIFFREQPPKTGKTIASGITGF